MDATGRQTSDRHHGTPDGRLGNLPADRVAYMTLQVWHNNPPEQNESEWYVKIEAEGKLDADGSKVTSVH